MMLSNFNQTIAQQTRMKKTKKTGRCKTEHERIPLTGNLKTVSEIHKINSHIQRGKLSFQMAQMHRLITAS